MAFSLAIWIIIGAVLVAPIGVLYKRYLHPAWRKQRQLFRACEDAFGGGGYRLTRIRTMPEEPSVWDIIPRPFGLADTPRYFTYNIEPLGNREPDFSGMSRREIRLVQHYLKRSHSTMVHHGKQVLRPEEETSFSTVGNPSPGESVPSK